MIDFADNYVRKCRLNKSLVNWINFFKNEFIEQYATDNSIFPVYWNGQFNSNRFKTCGTNVVWLRKELVSYLFNFTNFSQSVNKSHLCIWSFFQLITLLINLGQRSLFDAFSCIYKSSWFYKDISCKWQLFHSNAFFRNLQAWFLLKIPNIVKSFWKTFRH